MKLLPAVLLAALLAIGCAANPKPQITILVPNDAPTQAAPVRELTDTIEDSIVRLTVMTPHDGTYICTGFSIDVRVYLTDEHCVAPLKEYPGSILQADGHPAFVLKEDATRDLAVIVVDLVKPALEFNPILLSRGDAVQAIGYGEGFTKPTITNHYVMILNYTLAEDIYPGTIYLYPFIGGMSGGPVFDGDGKVVGIVQRSSDTIAYGVDVSTILTFLGGK